MPSGQRMEIVLNRRGEVTVVQQLVAQLEMHILSGRLAHGEKLPSVRALARRLGIHHNTVSAAYGSLEASGHVILQRGAGVFVRAAAGGPEEAGLDEIIRLALRDALEQGHSGMEIRAAVERWLSAVPPDSILVVDPSCAMAELLAEELSRAGMRASAAALSTVEESPGLLANSLTVALPYHVPRLRALSPGAAVEEVTLQVAPATQRTIEALKAGAIVLVVSHSPTVLPFARKYLDSVRGDELVGEAHLLADDEGWQRLLPAADLVLTDVVSTAKVQRARPRRLHEFRFLDEAVCARIREALALQSPPVAR